MTVIIKLFAILKDRAGVSEIAMQLQSNSTVSDAVAVLASRHESIARFLPKVAYAVNQNYVPAGTELHDGDELALIPPVSGG
jgi:molybdopterin synthase sulfur carrier subunit